LLLSTASSAGVGGRAAAGAILMIASRLITRGIDLATLVILGHLLSPADFGLVAIAMSVMFIVESVSELPILQALIRLPVLSKAHYDTGFTIAILRAMVLAITLCALAWPLAQLYGDDRLIGLLCTLWIAPAGRSFGSPVFVEFFRRFEFRPVLAIEITGKTLAFLASVSLAWWTASYWSISAGTIIAPVSMAIISYFVAPYRPKLSLLEWREFASFFGWSTASQLVNAVNVQLDQLILARFVGAVELGRFSMANNLANLPTQVVVAQVVNPLVAAFSHIRGDRRRLATAYQNSAITMVAIGFPAMVGLSMIAEPAIRLVLGPQWLESASILRWLAIAVLPYFFVSALGPLTMALGRNKIFLQLTTIELCLRLPLTLPAALYFGITGVVVVRLALAFVMAICSMIAVRGLIGLSVVAQLVSPWRPAAGGLAMAMALKLLQGWLDGLQGVVQLALGLTVVVGIAAAVYSGTVFLLWHIAGRPDGVEAKASALLSSLTRKIAAQLNR
jgi:O-antigen/teichoic acid export membrane protein